MLTADRFPVIIGHPCFTPSVPRKGFLVQDVLIFGCGYLGARLAQRCLRAGRRVLATTRSADRAAAFREAGLDPIVCDVTDASTLTTLPRVDTVVYCVGLDRSAGKSMREVYVDGLQNVLKALSAPRLFLLVSSTSVYGQQNGEEVDETAATEPTEESGQIVLAAECVVRSLLPAAIILRFAGIYGPNRMLKSKALRLGEALALNPARWVNLIHVDDGVTAILAAEQRGRCGAVYNVCDDRPVLRREFYEHLARILNAPPPRFEPPWERGFTGRDTTNRRVSNRRMRQELGVELVYPDYVAGLGTSAWPTSPSP